MNTSYTLTSDITLRLLKHLCFSGSWSKFGVADGRLSRLGSFSWSWSCWGSGPFLVSAPLSRCLVPTGLGAMVATCRYVRWVKCVALSWEGETQGNTRITLNYSIWQSLTIWKKNPACILIQVLSHHIILNTNWHIRKFETKIQDYNCIQ